MATMDLKAFTRLASELAEKLPQRLLRDLNGGISVQAAAKPDGKYWLMGEYIEDLVLGNVIFIYYGSFREVLGDAPRAEWEDELEETIVHELRHHVESLAGVDYLAREEEMEYLQDADGEDEDV